jgi:2'-5' RNA ligase
MSNTKRVFVGIDLSRKLTAVIPLLRTTVIGPGEDVRWISGRNLHLTLSFLGNISEEEIILLSTHLKEVQQLPKFTITVDGTGSFPDVGAPKILWMGVDKGHDELADLQSIVDEISVPYKEKKQEEHFVPHITIGRLKHKKNHSNFDVSAFMNTVYSPIEISINTVSLYESNLTPEGPRYTILSSFLLR